MEITSHYKNFETKSKKISLEGFHLKHPIALTIGNFDGVHLGHQKIFQTMHELTQSKGSSVVITFSNHPLEIIDRGKKIFRLTPQEEKLSLLKTCGIDLTVLLEFDEKLMNMSYEVFLKELKESIPFDYLVLGEGASFGKNQEGDALKLKECEKSLGFRSFYVPRIKEDEKIICSKLIRELLEKGEVEKVTKYLGRCYTLYAPHHLLKLQETGEKFLKITYDFQNMCLIPSGHYLISLLAGEHECSAVAYLTTLKSDSSGKTLDLEIFIKSAKAPYMNDEVRIEFVKKINKVDLEQELEKTSCKIIPFKTAR